MPSNKKELIEHLQNSQVTSWVPRKLLIKILGAEVASKHLPSLPDRIAVNTRNVLRDVLDSAYEDEEEK